MTGLYNAKYHILAILTVAVWGTTFISTKVLINNGLTPHEIFFIRICNSLYQEYGLFLRAGYSPKV